MTGENFIIVSFLITLMSVGLSGAISMTLGFTIGKAQYKRAAQFFALGFLFVVFLSSVFLGLMTDNDLNIAINLTLSNFSVLVGFYFFLYGFSMRSQRPTLRKPYIVVHVLIFSVISFSLSHPALIGNVAEVRMVFLELNFVAVVLLMFQHVKLDPDKPAPLGEKIIFLVLCLNLVMLTYYPFVRVYTHSIMEYLAYRTPVQVLQIHIWVVGLLVMLLSDLINIYHKQASTDNMTDLYNRRYFLNAVKQHLDDTPTPSALIVCDIDLFKAINDSYGHGVGDEVIIAFAQTLKAHTSKDCVCARFGGEEFAIYLPDTTLERAQQIANELKDNAQAIEITSGTDCITFTVSFGVTQLSNVESLDHALNEADKALYEAKHTGRNQVKIFTPPPPRSKSSDLIDVKPKNISDNVWR